MVGKSASVKHFLKDKKEPSITRILAQQLEVQDERLQKSVVIALHALQQHYASTIDKVNFQEEGGCLHLKQLLQAYETVHHDEQNSSQQEHPREEQLPKEGEGNQGRAARNEPFAHVLRQTAAFFEEVEETSGR